MAMGAAKRLEARWGTQMDGETHLALRFLEDHPDEAAALRELGTKRIERPILAPNCVTGTIWPLGCEP